jgi:hypothetical protein
MTRSTFLHCLLFVVAALGVGIVLTVVIALSAKMLL